MPVAFALMGTSLVFIASLRGLTAALNPVRDGMVLHVQQLHVGAPDVLSADGLPLFHSRFGEDLYRTARNWCGHFRGGLAIASVCACTALGAVVGDALVGCIAMMTIALPEMRRHGYDDKLAIGTLACSGGIGSLIPPSSNFHHLRRPCGTEHRRSVHRRRVPRPRVHGLFHRRHHDHGLAQSRAGPAFAPRAHA